MNQYLFHCRDCNKEFTLHLHIAELEKGGMACPHCGSTQISQLVTQFSAITAKKT